MRKFAMVFAAALLCLTLAACGSKAPANGTANNTTNSATTGDRYDEGYRDGYEKGYAAGKQEAETNFNGDNHIGNAVGDVVNGVGDAVGDVVNGAENAVDDITGNNTARNGDSRMRRMMDNGRVTDRDGILTR